MLSSYQSSKPQAQEKEGQRKKASFSAPLLAIIAAVAVVSLLGSALVFGSPKGAPIQAPDLHVKRSIVSRALVNSHATPTIVELGTPTYTKMPYTSGSYDNEYDKLLDVRRTLGALCQVRSEHSNSREDRRFALLWCAPDNGAPGWGPITTLSKTEKGKEWKRECASNQFLVGVRSEHSNSKEDRDFAWRCAEFGATRPESYRQANCQWDSDWVNDWDKTFTKTCPTNMVLAGVESKDSGNGFLGIGAKHDRKFKFKCCNIVFEHDIEGTVCHHFDTPTTLRSNQEIFSAVPYAENMRISFFTTIRSGSAFGNVLQLGKGNEDEWPAIFYNTGEPPNFLDFTFAKEGDDGEAIGRIPVTLDKELFVEVLISGLTATIRLEGKDERFVAIPDSVRPSPGATFPVFASASWNAAASGKIHGLEICSSDGELPPPCHTCQQIEGPIPVAKGLKLFMVEVGNNYDLSFYLTVADGSPSGALLQIGNEEKDAAPSIGYLNNGYLSFAFEVSGQSRDAFSYNAQVKAGVEMLVEVKVRDRTFELSIDAGTMKYTKSINDEARLRASNVYLSACGAWASSVASATLRNLQFCAH